MGQKSLLNVNILIYFPIPQKYFFNENVTSSKVVLHRFPGTQFHFLIGYVRLREFTSRSRFIIYVLQEFTSVFREFNCDMSISITSVLVVEPQYG